jgi:hypothetical protein
MRTLARPSTCGACGWATKESRTRVWCWFLAKEKFVGSITCPDAMANTPEAFQNWREEREREIWHERGQ